MPTFSNNFRRAQPKWIVKRHVPVIVLKSDSQYGRTIAYALQRVLIPYTLKLNCQPRHADAGAALNIFHSFDRYVRNDKNQDTSNVTFHQERHLDTGGRKSKHRAYPPTKSAGAHGTRPRNKRPGWAIPRVTAATT
ncbi:hypothetical protein EVAR_36651_1 [Eumeta japonica]|uniref:Uncharacterized protein n=1 Tax=Eumeta variegata TaxID=151549 RepID=A0A4C1XZA9_EUMVA|nr:hypothetical protein EVAR_36651_1 [Eumeta japonica]